MPKETSLDILINLAQDRLDEAGHVLADLSTQRRNAQQQLGTLDGYRSDYARRLQSTTEGGLTASNYHNFRHFIATLDEAISQQNRIIAQIDTQIETGRRQWHAEKRQLNSYETLKTRQLRQFQYREQRREQRASDEISAGLYRRQQPSH
ncbi:flagellar export protein FliJ [Castellaniella caeni]|uniref:flagellar export protein FliJ n=1 Tax=Castellaniella caeni TaxID=266123 RepID=UPI00082AC8C9|nr:flagellar export protein FliJ [Castellaniella caeni]